MRIAKGETKIITVTVTEMTTLTSPHYLLEMIGSSKVPKYFVLGANLSTETQRYDKFQVIEGTNITLDLGDNEYNIYEQVSAVAINPTGLNLVETGICEVYETESASSEYTGGIITNLVYSG